MYHDFYSTHIPHLKVVGSQAYGKCPLHPDRVSSFYCSIETGLWTCAAGCGSGNALTFSRLAGVSPPVQHGGLFEDQATSSTRTARAQTLTPKPKKEGGTSRPPSKFVCEYIYQDANGTEAYRVVRLEPKSFRLKHRVDGNWVWNARDVTRVPYNLPNVLKCEKTIWLTEGEKDADRLIGLGLVATCTPLGASNWTEDYAHYFKDKRVAIVPDNDPQGEEYACAAARDIHRAGGTVKLLRLPGLRPKGDVSDFMDDYANTVDTLLSLVRDATIYGKVELSKEDPVDYFSRLGLAVNDGALSLPHEFRALCKEAFRLVSGYAGACNDEAYKRVQNAEWIWSRCRTRQAYQGFLKEMKEMHEFSMREVA